MKQQLAVLLTGLLSVLSMPVEAHTGYNAVHDFQAGLWHPLSGIDHLLVMIGVGLLAGFLGGVARGWLPAVFLAAMAAGSFLHFAGIRVQGAEIAVAASVFAMGVILMWSKRSRLGGAMGLASLFACSHGYVHALEAGTDRQAFYYADGVIVSTALLLGIGVLIGQFSARRGRWFKTAFGVICAGAGISFLLGI